MSDELLNKELLLNEGLLKNEELDVEAHKWRPASDEPAEDEENEVEAHKYRPKRRPKYRP